MTNKPKTDAAQRAETTTDPDKLPPRGLATNLFNAAHDCFDLLRRQHALAWEALRNAPDEAIAVYPCFVDGRATTALGLLLARGKKVIITPLFIAPTDNMTITGHAGQPTIDYPYDEVGQ